MRQGNTTTTRRRRRDEIGQILSAAQRQYLLPFLIAKVKDAKRSIPYSRIRGLALFREFKTEGRRLEILIRNELSDIKRHAEIADRRRKNGTQVRACAWEQSHATQDDIDAVIEGITASHKSQVDEQRKRHEEAMAWLRAAHQHESELHGREVSAKNAEHQDAIEAARTAHQWEERRLRDEVSKLRTVQADLQVQLAYAEEELRNRHQHELRCLSSKYERDFRSLVDKYDALKAELSAEWETVRSLRAQLHDFRWVVEATKQELAASEERGEKLTMENILYRAGPDIETRMRALAWQLRSVARDATMEEVRKTLSSLYADAYKIVHDVVPRWLIADVDDLMREWWVGRCQLAHKVVHGVDAAAYRNISRRVSSVLEDLDAVLVRGDRQTRMRMGSADSV